MAKGINNESLDDLLVILNDVDETQKSKIIEYMNDPTFLTNLTSNDERLDFAEFLESIEVDKDKITSINDILQGSADPTTLVLELIEELEKSDVLGIEDILDSDESDDLEDVDGFEDVAFLDENKDVNKDEDQSELLEDESDDEFMLGLNLDDESELDGINDESEEVNIFDLDDEDDEDSELDNNELEAEDEDSIFNLDDDIDIDSNDDKSEETDIDTEEVDNLFSLDEDLDGVGDDEVDDTLNLDENDKSNESFNLDESSDEIDDIFKLDDESEVDESDIEVDEIDDPINLDDESIDDVSSVDDFDLEKDINNSAEIDEEILVAEDDGDKLFNFNNTNEESNSVDLDSLGFDDELDSSDLFSIGEEEQKIINDNSKELENDGDIVSINSEDEYEVPTSDPSELDDFEFEFEDPLIDPSSKELVQAEDVVFGDNIGSLESDDDGLGYGLDDEDDNDNDGLDYDLDDEEEEDEFGDDEVPEPNTGEDEENDDYYLDNYEDEAPKKKLPIKNLAIAVAAIVGVGAGGFIIYDNLMGDDFDDYQSGINIKDSIKQDDKPKVESKPKAPKETKPVEKVESQFDKDLDNLSVDEFINKSEPVKVDTVSQEKLKELDKLKSLYDEIQEKISKIEKENRELKTALKESISNNEQLIKEVNKIKIQIEDDNIQENITKKLDEDRSYHKETMMKLLGVTKSLKGEIEDLKVNKVDKSELLDVVELIDLSFDEIDEIKDGINEFNKKQDETGKDNPFGHKIEIKKPILLKFPEAEVEKAKKELNIKGAKPEIINSKKIKLIDEPKPKKPTVLDRGYAEKNVNKKQSIENRELRRKTASELLRERFEKRNQVIVEYNKQQEEKTVQRTKKPVGKVNVSSVDYSKFNYVLIGTIEGVIYLRNNIGSIDNYRVNDILPGYGQIQKINEDGSVITNKGNFKFKQSGK